MIVSIFKEKQMNFIENKIFDEERALYGSRDIELYRCSFDGAADGESAFKESSNIAVRSCYFNLRYPFWHDTGVSVLDSEMTDKCRAALWYTRSVKIEDSRLHGIKALRECSDIDIKNCDISSAEFGWFSSNIRMADSSAEGEYFMLRAKGLEVKNLDFRGKYSFQYIEGAAFDNCRFDTKDAFWHAKGVTVKNSVVAGEYLAWYCEDVTFENCLIIGTQPLCYCRGLRLINCKMEGCDLAFEKSEVEADVRSHVISIKNPASGKIFAEEVSELILTDESATCKIEIGSKKEPMPI